MVITRVTPSGAASRIGSIPGTEIPDARYTLLGYVRDLDDGLRAIGEKPLGDITRNEAQTWDRATARIESRIGGNSLAASFAGDDGMVYVCTDETAAERRAKSGYTVTGDTATVHPSTAAR